MLLRAGLVYVLSVLTVMFGALAAWQHLDISLRDENIADLGKRVIALQVDLEALRRREDAAVRRARVAEDSLSRNQTYNTSDINRLNEARAELEVANRDKATAETSRARLEADLAQAIKERDHIRFEKDELQRVADEARIAADKAMQEADAAREALVDLKKATSQVQITPPAVAVVPDTAVATPAPAAPQVSATPDQLVRPAAREASTDITSEAKATLVPNAVTNETPAKSDGTAASTRAPKAASRRPATKSESANNKVIKKTPPKQAKKDDSFFPF